ncbi:MAG: hypothetical protein E5V25_00890, partial [Mesorhizobium sp.]
MAEGQINAVGLIRRHRLFMGRPISGQLQHGEGVRLIPTHPLELLKRELAELAGAHFPELFWCHRFDLRLGQGFGVVD